LFHLLDCADNYIAPFDDIALLPIIKDALGSRSQMAKMATQVFKNYNHLWGGRNEPVYAGVFRAITGGDDLKSFAKYQGWMVVTAFKGANMKIRE